MAENSKIAWTDHTFNPWWGCVKVSEGCKHCYAEAFSKRVGHDIWGANAPRRFFGDEHWRKPLLWNEKAKRDDKRARVFCASMADVFEDRPDLIGPRKRLMDLIDKTRDLDWLLLTKRPENISGMLYALPSNVWLGTTVEMQKHIYRVMELIQNPATVHFISVEPMLEPINLAFPARKNPRRDVWVIVGGESGAGCRPFDWDWARDIRDQCKDAGVPFFMKQGGGWPDKRENLEDIPEDLQIRDFPQ